MASSVLAQPYVTNLVLCESFFVVRNNPDHSMIFGSSAIADLATAKVAAEHFAKAQGIPFVSKLLMLNKPIVTCWKTKGGWVPAKLFPYHVEGTGMLIQKREVAELIAKGIAKAEKLEFLSIFNEPTGS